MSFKVNIFTFIGFFVLVLLGPLTMFAPQLLESSPAADRIGSAGDAYVADFDKKWLRGERRVGIVGYA